MIPGKKPPRETDPALRKAGAKNRAVNRKVPKAVYDAIVSTFLAGITGKRIEPGDTIREIVARHCPHVHEMAAEAGLVFNLSAPENTTDNLRMGKVFFRLEPATRH